MYVCVCVVCVCGDCGMCGVYGVCGVTYSEFTRSYLTMGIYNIILNL